MRPVVCLPRSSQPPARPPSFPLPPSRSRIPENTLPSPRSPESAPPTPGLSRPALAQRVRSPPGRERADANSAPAPRPPPRAGFRLHARLPRAAPGCASRFAPQPPGAPQPRAPGEEGRAPGAGLVCANPAGPRPPPSVLRQSLAAAPSPETPRSSSRRFLACPFWGRFSAELLHST